MSLPKEILFVILEYIEDIHDVVPFIKALSLDHDTAFTHWCGSNPHIRQTTKIIKNIMPCLKLAVTMGLSYHQNPVQATRSDLRNLFEFCRLHTAGLEDHVQNSWTTQMIRLKRKPNLKFTRDVFCPIDNNIIPHYDPVFNPEETLNPCGLLNCCRLYQRELIFKTAGFELKLYTRGLSCVDIIELISTLEPLKPVSIKVVETGALRNSNLLYVMGKHRAVLNLNLWS